jgi:putative Mg2+ transporter-C (MgtC) family protein
VDSFVNELASGAPDADQLARITIRLVLAALVGAIVGYQRERVGKAAGLRTHMLVSLGAAVFILAGVESGMSDDDLSRIMQGLATGIGFLGGGAILKITTEREISGLTTAAGIWLTAGVGVAVGLGHWGLAIAGAVLTWVVLGAFFWLEPAASRDSEPGDRAQVDDVTR